MEWGLALPSPGSSPLKEECRKDSILALWRGRLMQQIVFPFSFRVSLSSIFLPDTHKHTHTQQHTHKVHFLYLNSKAGELKRPQPHGVWRGLICSPPLHDASSGTWCVWLWIGSCVCVNVCACVCMCVCVCPVTQWLTAGGQNTRRVLGASPIERKKTNTNPRSIVQGSGQPVP